MRICIYVCVYVYTYIHTYIDAGPGDELEYRDDQRFSQQYKYVYTHTNVINA